MPPPFQRLSLAQFATVLRSFDFRRRVTTVHMHHTYRPDHAQWKGHDSMVGMWRYHTVERGFSDIAQHLTIDPEGFVWTGRNWNLAPASAIGHNGTGVAGPFMFETVGDFDRHRDVLQGAQRAAVLDVIARVQRRFGLPPEALVFHNQMAGKSCPGTAIDREALLGDLRRHVPPDEEARPAPTARGNRAKDTRLPLPETALADQAIVQRALRLIEPDAAAARAAADATPLEEIDCGHPDGHGWSGNEAASTMGGRGAAQPSPAQLDALRPHVINLRMGRFSDGGLMSSTPADVEALVHEHLARAAVDAAADGQPLRIVLYAHGGLVKESDGLALAARHVDWWRGNGVYPVHFVWETGLFETIGSLLERARSPLVEAERRRGVSDWLTDRLSDPLIETTVRALQIERIWGGMKASAEQASRPGGGAHFFLDQLAGFCKGLGPSARGAAVELHAVGHSAGSIFLAHLLDAASKLDLPALRSLQLLAPALRTDRFRALIEPRLGPGQGIDALTVYTMRRDFERADHCAGIYRKSLLYLVSASAEAERGAALLGLEESLRADAALRTLFGLGTAGRGVADVVWSTSPTADGRSASRATRHGAFDDDAPTLNSVARRVLGLEDAAPLPRPFVAPPAGRGARDGRNEWRDAVDWPEELASLLNARPAAGPASPALPLAAPLPDGLAPAFDALTPLPGGGRRLALCVGIDDYPGAPLQGCANDARRWRQTLQALGFTVGPPLLDAEATHAGLHGAIEALFASARPGDELVFQFAGHGTQVDDENGDEAAGDTPGRDEALCPHDFASGALLLDDDLGALIDRLPAGVHLTLFMDCCHSGDVSRFGAGRPPPPAARSRPRFVPPTPWLQAAHSAWRLGQARPAPRAAGAHPELLFTACRSGQLAWESDGHGEFTLHATRALASAGAAGLTASALHRRVLDGFGAAPRQEPQLTGPPARLGRPLFGHPGGARP